MNRRDRQTISPLFGEIAVQLGLCTADQVVDALCVQDEQSSRGRKASRVGRILVGLGHLTPEDVAAVMAEMETRILALELPGFEKLTLVSQGHSTLTYRGRVARAGQGGIATIVLLRFGLAASRESLMRFLSDARSLSRLDHPNVVRVLGVDEVEGVPYLVMEHLTGPNLRGHLEENGRLPADVAMRVLGEVADGLAHAHSHYVLHGSLRPAAIHLPRSGGAKVGGFSLTGWRSTAATVPTTRVKMPHYIAPEEARGVQPTVKSDIYSLGATFFHALTGRPPFKGRYQEVVRQHLRRPPPDLRVLAPGVDEGLAQLVERMLEKDPGRRPVDMREVAGTVARMRSPQSTPEVANDSPSSAPPGRLMTCRRRTLVDEQS